MDTNFQVNPLMLIFFTYNLFFYLKKTIFADQNLIEIFFNFLKINLHTQIQETYGWPKFICHFHNSQVTLTCMFTDIVLWVNRQRYVS